MKEARLRSEARTSVFQRTNTHHLPLALVFELLANERRHFIKLHLVFSPYRHGCFGFLRFWEIGYRPCLTFTLHQICFTLCKITFKKETVSLKISNYGWL